MIEIAVCKNCKTPVLYHKKEFVYICSECGRRDGSAMLIEVMDRRKKNENI